MTKKIVSTSIVICTMFMFIGCGGGGGGDTPSNPPVANPPVVTPPVVTPPDDIYSDDSGLKSLGDLGTPPLYISSEEPTANTQVSITAEGITGNIIDITVEGSGCGTIQNTSGTSPLTIVGNVGAYGDCNIRASYDISGKEEAIAGRFIVAATDPVLPPAHIDAGTWVIGDVPTPSTVLDSDAKKSAGLPVISTVEGPLEFINGGTSEFTVSSASGSNIAAILVQIDSYDGYFHVPVYTSGNSAKFKLSFDSHFFDEAVQKAILMKRYNSVTGSVVDLSIRITIIDDLNQVSESHALALQANETGTGDVKVSISWNTATDVDLHVTDPNGVTTYYGNKTPGNGSTLDLDSNAGCSIDGVNNENIYWSTGTAVPGEYTVKINMWSDCDKGGASGTVTMIYNGDDSPRVVSWSLGSSGSQTYIFTHEGAESKVSGKVTYEDFPISKTGLGSSRMLPVRFAEVQVVRAEDNVVLATGSTDASGKYELTFKNEDLEHPGYYVLVYARQNSETLKQEVENYAGKVYAFKSTAVVNEIETPEKEDMDIAITKDKNAGAMNIFDVGVICNDYARTNGGKVPEKLEFHWQANGADGSYYSSSKKRIVLLGETADPDEYDDIIIGHEYGHFVMDTYSDDDSPGGNHTLAPSTATLAWSEGWATYFAAAALNKSFYLDTISSGVGSYYSIESLPSSIKLGNVGDVLDGNVSEAVVSAILWDLHDTTNEASANSLDGFDDLSNQSTAIWKILTTYLNGTNFKDRGKAGVDTVDFIDAWYCLGYG
ncbi:MAG: hypothetical protein U9Q91_04080, partial [Candidatus Marinimicrobia bacterium]|nr:hypothetical protein [Candidatus Neomarinimicrobiota bacterium]